MKYLFHFFIVFYPFLSIGNDSSCAKAENYMVKSQYDSAIYFYSQEASLIEKEGGIEFATVLIKRGNAYKMADKHEGALIDYINAEKVFEKENDHNGLVVTYTNLAELFRKLQNFDKAEFYLDKAERYLESGQVSNIVVGKFYNRKAAVLNENDGDIKEIIFYSKKVIELAKKTNNISLEATSLNELGFVYEKQNDPNCIDYYTKAHDLFIQQNDLMNGLNVLINLIRYHNANEKYESSLNYIEEAFILCEGRDFTAVNIKLYYFQYLALEHLDRFEEANIALSNYYNADKEIIEIEWNKSLKEIESKYDLELKNNEIEIQKNNATLLKLDAITKATQRNYIAFVSILLTLILTITVIAYLKIKKTNQKLNSNLEQKEILVQEVHHRVKNNLTTLKSLFFLQAKSSDDDNVVNVLNECQSRIQAMSLVYQSLYNVNNTSSVDFGKFVKQLTYESISILDNRDQQISVNIKTNALTFGMGTAVSLGLIINEFVSNSLKHAFKTLNKGEVSIVLEEHNANYILKYSDSAEDLGSDFKPEDSKSFGFKLINLMVSQIDGTLTYDRPINTYIINFSI